MNTNEFNPLLEFQEGAKSNYTNFQNINSNPYYKNNLNQNTGANFFNNKTVVNGGDKNQFPKTYNNQNNKPNNSINWKNVMRVDLNVIRNTNDLSLLSSYLGNFLFSPITEDDIQAVPEEHILKLIQILQFCVEYLLYSRQNLNSNIMNREQEKENLKNELEKLETDLTNLENNLEKLKAERKKRIGDIAFAKNAVDALIKNETPNFPLGNTNITDINVDINRKYRQSQTRFTGNLNGFKCMYCLGITFPSKHDLKRHLNDIHLIKQFPDDEYDFSRTKVQQKLPQINVSIPPLNNFNNANNNELLERKLIEMKMNYQETLNKEKLEKLRSQLSKLKEVGNEEFNCKLQVERLGNIFNDTLRQMVNLIPKNQEKQKIIIQPKNENLENDLKIKEEINSLMKDLENAKNRKEEKRKEYIEKISNYEKEITTLNIQRTEIIEDINKKNDILPKKGIYTAEQKEPFIIRKNNIKKKGKRGKFHSGLLESDHDDSEEERKKEMEALEKLKEESEFFKIITKPKKIILRDANPNIVPEQEDLEHFYERYIKRDKKYIKDPQFKKYLKEVLPSNYIQNNGICNNAKIDINDKLFNTARFFYDEKQMKILPECDENNLKKERKTDLLNLVDILFKDFDILKNDNKREDMKQYYNSVQNLLDFKDIKETIKNDIEISVDSIDENRNRLREKENYSNLNDSNKLKSVPKVRKNFGINDSIKAPVNSVNDAENNNNGKTNNDYKNNINSNINQYQISNTENNKFEEYSDNQIGDSMKFQNSNLAQNQSNLPNINNKATDTNYSSDKIGEFKIPQIVIREEGQKQPATDTNYSSNKMGQFDFPQIKIRDEGQKQQATDTNYSSDKMGRFNNNQPNLGEQSKQNIFSNQSSTYLNQEKSPNVPFSSKIEGEGKKRETVNDNNKINDLVGDS